MENIWTQHLKKSEANGHGRHASFTMMLHSLVKEKSIPEQAKMSEEHFTHEISPAKNDDVEISQLVTTQNLEVQSDFATKINEVARWTAKSQRGYELETDEFEVDYVQLLKYPDGQLILKYNVTGDDIFEMKVASEEEAVDMITEDNATTSQLYPNNPELQWHKNNANLI
jgi:hypothetical protein